MSFIRMYMNMEVDESAAREIAKASNIPEEAFNLDEIALYLKIGLASILNDSFTVEPNEGIKLDYDVEIIED